MDSSFGPRRLLELSEYYFLKTRLAILRGDPRTASLHAEASLNSLFEVGSSFFLGLRYLSKAHVAHEVGRHRHAQEYKENPNPKEKKYLEDMFDKIFATKTHSATLNAALKRIYANESELLLVLDRPDIPLHNNTAENAIREYVKKRKISGSTRSESGRQSRDTFTSLKKTCRKLGVSFWQYLNDRIKKINLIPNLSDLIRQQALKPG